MSGYEAEHTRGSELSENWFRTLLNNTSDVIIVLEADGTVRYASPAVQTVLGYRPDEVVGMIGFDYVHDEDLAFVSEAFLEILKTPGVHTPVEFRTQAADGSLRHVEALPNNQLDNPVLRGVVVTFRDLTERARAEEKVRLQARLLDAVGQAVIATDRRGRIVYWNKAAEKLYGWSAVEATGRSVLEVTLPEQDPHRGEEIMSGLREGRSWSGDFEQRRKDGTHFPAMITTTPALDERGNLVGIIGVSTNIAERKEMEAALERLSRRNQLILDSAGEGIYGLDKRGTTTFVNPAAAAMTGFTPEELIGEHLHDVVHHSYPDRTPFPERECRVYAALKDGQVHRVDNEVFWRKDGTSFPVEYTSTPIYEDGNLSGAVVTFRDITERREAERRLREAEARYRTLVEQVPALIYVDTLDGVGSAEYTSPQAEAMLDYTLSEWRTDPEFWVRLLHPEDSERVLAQHLRANAEKEPLGLEYRMVAKDGRIVWIHDDSVILYDSEGRPRWRQGIMSDITERKRAEEALQQSEEFISQLLRNFPNGSVSVFDRDLYYVFADGNLTEQLGLLPETVIGRNLREVLPEESINFAMRYYRKALAGEAVEFELTHHGGVYAISAAPLRSENGNIHAIISISQNITGRKRVEKDLRNREERFRYLVQNSSDVITMVDVNGTVLYVSPAIKRILGYNATERMGRSAFELVHPDDVERAKAVFTTALQNPGRPVSLEIRMRHTDGSWRDVEVTGTNLLAEPSTNAIVLNSRDITERRLAEMGLREAEERYRTLVEQIPAIIYIDAAGEPGRTIYVSPQIEAILGYSPREVLQDPIHWIRIMHPEDRERVLAENRRTDETGDPFRMEYRQFAKDGSVVWLRDEADLVRGREGKPLCWLGVQTDVTERKALEEELRR